jgi:hypothetical protein
MRICFVQGNAGASGDMLLGALVDAGVPLQEMNKCVQELNLPDTRIRGERVVKKGISGMKVRVEYPKEDQHRHLHDIEEIINRSSLSVRVKKDAIEVFRSLAKAEAKVHNCSVNEIHFHEVGAIDAIVDIVGTCYGLEYLGIEEIFCSPLRVGYGEVTCAHGVLPIPAPATAELLKGVPCYAGEYRGEWVTPTGAALLTTLCKGWSEMPIISMETIGYGAGSADREVPNLLRLVVGTTSDLIDYGKEIEVLETTVDDMNPELFPYLGERLLEIPVLDYYLTSVMMKKGRIGNKLTVLVEPEKAKKAMEVIFQETSTLGVRRLKVNRACLEREVCPVEVYGEKIRVKVGLYSGKMVQAAPEYEDCKLAAKATGKPLKEIYDETIKIYREKETNN